MNYLSPSVSRFSMHFRFPSRRIDVIKPLDVTTKRTAAASTPTDEKLMASIAQARDIKAFEQLFSRYAGKIVAYGIKLSQNEQMGKDLVQDVMLAVWQKASLFNASKGSVQTWIYTLVRNRCFDLMRKNKRQPALLGSDDIWSLDTGDEPLYLEDHEVIASLEQRELYRMCRSLPTAQQQIIQHVYVLGLSQSEAAGQLGIPLGTVKSRLRLAVDKLRQLMAIEE